MVRERDAIKSNSNEQKENKGKTRRKREKRKKGRRKKEKGTLDKGLGRGGEGEAGEVRGREKNELLYACLSGGDKSDCSSFDERRGAERKKGRGGACGRCNLIFHE